MDSWTGSEGQEVGMSTDNMVSDLIGTERGTVLLRIAFEGRNDPVTLELKDEMAADALVASGLLMRVGQLTYQITYNGAQAIFALADAVKNAT